MSQNKHYLKLMFSKKASKIDKIFTVNFNTYLVNIKSRVKILSIFVAFLENMNFTYIYVRMHFLN